ncbi:hypothetical protein DL762_001820 [Monosporascus cannonballus]|uniref:Uncharacterized protein n=1 Tax=Monosporascus cannonballus TaxID=155416 RepID=A0ABY0HID6_9PEZI|nr:hypothetical protein DL762_001820 [Monosporascus cannonballus]
MSEPLTARLRNLSVDDLDKMELAAPTKTEDVNSDNLSNIAAPSTLPFTQAPASHTGDPTAMSSAPLGKRIKNLQRFSRPIFNSGSATWTHRKSKHRLPKKLRGGVKKTGQRPKAPFGNGTGKRYYAARQTTGVDPLALYQALEQVQKETARSKFENGSNLVQDDAEGSTAHASQQFQGNLNLRGASFHGRDSGKVLSRISGGLADFDDADLDPASGYHPGTPITYNDGNFQDWMPKNIKRRSMSRSASFFEEREQGHQEQGHAQQDGDVEMGGF